MPPLLRDSQVFRDHSPANRVVEIPVLLIRLQSQILIHLGQGPEKRPHELHAAHLTQQLGDQRVGAGDLGSQGDSEVGRLEFYILALEEVIDLTHLFGPLGAQRLFEVLDLAEEHELLVGTKFFDVLGGGVEALDPKLVVCHMIGFLAGKVLTLSFHWSASL